MLKALKVSATPQALPHVRCNHAYCHTTSRGQKKFATGRIWRTRLFIVVGHRASTGEKMFVEVSRILQCVVQYRRTILNFLGEHLMNDYDSFSASSFWISRSAWS